MEHLILLMEFWEKPDFVKKKSFRYLFGNKSFMNLFECFLTTNFDDQASKLEDHHMHVGFWVKYYLLHHKNRGYEHMIHNPSIEWCRRRRHVRKLEILKED